MERGENAELIPPPPYNKVVQKNYKGLPELQPATPVLPSPPDYFTVADPRVTPSAPPYTATQTSSVAVQCTRPESRSTDDSTVRTLPILTTTTTRGKQLCGHNDYCYYCECCDIKWNRCSGFCCSCFWFVVGALAIAAAVAYMAFRRDMTLDFIQTNCTTEEHFLRENTTMSCECSGCEDSTVLYYACHVVLVRFLLPNGNHSELIQIHAATDDLYLHNDKCSYAPSNRCQWVGTLQYFESRGALTPGAQYTCYHSPEEPRVVVLERYLTLGPVPIVLGAILVGGATILFLLVKCKGVMCGCPAQSEIIQRQREEIEELQMSIQTRAVTLGE